MSTTIVVPNRERIANYEPEAANALVDVATAAAADITALQNGGGKPAAVALTDANATITVAQGTWRVAAAALLTANRTVTLSTTGAVAGDQIQITRLDVGAFTLAIVNGGVGAGTLYTMAVSALGCATVQFNGTNWQLRNFGVQ